MRRFCHGPTGTHADLPALAGQKLLIAAAIATGILLRVWILSTPPGALDSDEAVVGLIGRHMLSGEEFPLMYWGQSYGGTIDSFLAAGIFAVAGSGVVTLKMVSVLLSAAAAVLTWRIGRRTVGEPAAQLAALLFWIWPFSFVLWSTKVIGGHHWPSFVLSLLAFLGFIRLVQWQEERSPLLLSFLTGIAGGLAWWGGAQALYLLVPGALWLLYRCRKKSFRFWPAIPGAVLGAVPWIAFNLSSEWASFQLGPQLPVGYWDRLVYFFRGGLTAALGLRIPSTCGCDFFSSNVNMGWVSPIAPLLLWTAIAGFFWLAFRRAKGTGLLIFTTAIYPFAFAFVPNNWYVNFPKFLLFLSPFITLLIAVGITRVSKHIVVRTYLLALATGMTITATFFWIAEGLPLPSAPDAPVPARIGGLVELLQDQGVNEVFTDYWIAYRLTFESKESIVATPIFTARYPPYDERVYASENPAFVFVRGSDLDPRMKSVLRRKGIPYARLSTAAFVVYVPKTRVTPPEIIEVWNPALLTDAT